MCGSRRLITVASLAILICFTMTAADDGEYVGAETCAVCHEEVVASFAKTAHAIAPGWEAEKGCEACHGPGAAHVDGEGDVNAIVRPQLLPRREGAERCLACHEREGRPFRSNHSMHGLADVGCIDCHNPHSAAEKLIEKPIRELCSGCHQAVAAQFDLPRSHPLPDRGAACANCHDPHGSRSLRTDTTLFRETCVKCHFEKAGPFLYEHDVTTVDGCVSCHEVHGSPNRHLLKHQTQVILCYQCHSGNVTPNFHSAPRFANEKCTACHTAIHGSNTNPFFLEE